MLAADQPVDYTEVLLYLIARPTHPFYTTCTTVQYIRVHGSGSKGMGEKGSFCMPAGRVSLSLLYILRSTAMQQKKGPKMFRIKIPPPPPPKKKKKGPKISRTKIPPPPPPKKEKHSQSQERGMRERKEADDGWHRDAIFNPKR